MVEADQSNLEWLPVKKVDSARAMLQLYSAGDTGVEHIPLHTSLLLKLARVCDAGSKIHHSL
ncbi:hypothetical protein WK05_14365, partial [Burkholderia ubonensis]